MTKSSFAKYISIFLLGLILGYLFKSFVVGSPITTLTPPTNIGKNSVKELGRKDALVTVTEYSDFQCPLCKKYFDETFPTILKDYVETGKVKYVFKQFPLNIHPEAIAAALASECAHEQNKFWEMHNRLFEKQAEWSGKSNHIETFKIFAKSLNLDQTKFDTCLDQKTFLANVNTEYNEGMNKNVRGTPTLYINNQPIIGAQETSNFTDLIDSMLNPAPPPTI